MAKESISHKGKIISISPKTTAVEFISSSACASCHAAGLCGMGEYKEKVVEVPTSPYSSHSVGDEVEVVLESSMGLKAVWIAYVVPVLLLMAAILIATKLNLGELFSALIGIGVVALYYFVIWLFRGKLENEYIFRIK